MPFTTAREETEIEVVDPLVTAEEFETEVRRILNEISAVADKVQNNTTAIQGQADAILEEVKDINPWKESFSWIVQWGGFGVLASFLAGLALALPAWEILKWLWRTVGRPLGARMVSYDYAAAIRRRRLLHVRDWLDGPWRR